MAYIIVDTIVDPARIHIQENGCKGNCWKGHSCKQQRPRGKDGLEESKRKMDGLSPAAPWIYPGPLGYIQAPEYILQVRGAPGNL